VDSLYQEKILAYAKACRALPAMAEADYEATLSNPVCGDRVEIGLTVDPSGRVAAATANVRGCALCEAGAGLFASIAPGQAVTHLASMTDGFAAWLGGDDAASVAEPILDFTPVRQIRNRHKCVLLSFEAACVAIRDAGKDA